MGKCCLGVLAPRSNRSLCARDSPLWSIVPRFFDSRAFTTRRTGRHSADAHTHRQDGALVTDFAEFTMPPSGQQVHGKIVVGEVWVKRGTESKAIYAQG